MKTFFDVISIIFLLGITLYPFFFIPKLRSVRLWFWFGIAIVITDMVFSLSYGAFDDVSTSWLIRYYGYDFTEGNDALHYAHVKDCDKAMVRSLMNHLMGIGWPLRAAFMDVMLTPFHIICIIVAYIWRKMRKASKQVKK